MGDKTKIIVELPTDIGLKFLKVTHKYNMDINAIFTDFAKSILIDAEAFPNGFDLPVQREGLEDWA